ncbi:MAG: geranylgeranylglyceryl/heptaprenylglyceryl phosphate synthase, partial [bacterium]|nr:geranylgeranylglyceryl/heptaprenylglyceryl phosphate synthase [bacterium]
AAERLYWVLLDPDDFSDEEAAQIAIEGQAAGVDGFLIGGSLLRSNHLDSFIASVKKGVDVPVILFPGDATQISAAADAILFLSLVSGRNPTNLIGEQVKGAPLIKECGIEPISTAYMLIESGAVTSVEFMSNTRPLPRSKPMIAAMHALAAQYMGMRTIYLEAGSGAPKPVPNKMISMVRAYVDIPIIVGGGIRDADTALEKIDAGADIIVTGNLLHAKSGTQTMREIAGAIKNYKKS